jgi:hypothetical protein
MGTVDGNYEFEHGAQVSQTTLNSYVIGTPNRTPVAVGGHDGQDVLAFSVRGMRGQKNDLQQWTLGEDVAVAVDGDGRLRLGEITLVAQVVNGKAELVGVLPNGHEAYAIARANPRIDMLLWFLLRDDTSTTGWQSGLETAAGQPKPSFAAFQQLATTR